MNKPRKARASRLKGAPSFVYRVQVHKEYLNDGITVWTSPVYDKERREWWKPFVAFSLSGNLAYHGEMRAHEAGDSDGQVDWGELPKQVRVYLTRNSPAYEGAA